MSVHAPVVPPSARSTYHRQLERIAPHRLLGRKAELAELAAFCLQEHRGPYVWWQAGPWAGKSALLSSFVLRPPDALTTAGVRLVSFFITARLASQDTREAFTAALAEQLCALLGRPLPVGGHESTQEAVLLDLLAEAAAACHRGGGRLVLLVDGLDEDRRATVGPHTHSIAALLPGRPPHGMRVIVAGRPNPPIPDDVPDWHPLRDAGIVRLLSDSPHARDLQRLGMSELARLATGSPLEQDLLGLLTAARGGLSGPDLRELTGAGLAAVQEVLHTVTGRTFGRRYNSWADPADRSRRPEVYLLGHEELQEAARHHLGPELLAGYRRRLHIWADGYRAVTDGRAPWPPGTSEYLFTGYPRMLADEGDTERLVGLTLDRVRHDRMLELSGGDTAALTEVTTCQDLLLKFSEPDLYHLARLSHHRSWLESRNAAIPDNLPAAWAALGETNRAEALARSLTDPAERSTALIKLIETAAAADDLHRARRLVGEAEKAARGVPDPSEQAWGALHVSHPFQQVWALAKVARAAATSGDRPRAGQLFEEVEVRARSIPDSSGRLAEVARVAAAAGDVSRARRLIEEVEEYARSVPGSSGREEMLAEVARVAAAAGDVSRARRLIEEVEEYARSVPGSSGREEMLAEVARVAAAAGDVSRARRLIEEVEEYARSVPDLSGREEMLAEVARVAAAAGDVSRARRLIEEVEEYARSVPDLSGREEMLAEVARVAAAAGDVSRASRLIEEANVRIRAIVDQTDALRTLAEEAEAALGDQQEGDAQRDRQLVGALADSNLWEEMRVWVAREALAFGDLHGAEEMARAVPDIDRRARLLIEVAGAAAAAGDLHRARLLVEEVEECPPTGSAMPGRAWILAEMARTAAAFGDASRARRLAYEAERTARAIPDSPSRAHVAVAGALAASGDLKRAEELTGAGTDLSKRPWALISAAVRAGDLKRAEELARDARRWDWFTQPQALAQVARAAATAGDLRRARRLADEAAKLVRAFRDPHLRGRSMAQVAEAAGDLQPARRLVEEAEALVRSFPDPSVRLQVLVDVAVAAAATGDLHRARRLVAEAEESVRAVPGVPRRAQILTQMAGVAAAVDDRPRALRLADQAEETARSITDPALQAEALVDLAESVGLPRAPGLLAEAFVLGPWDKPLVVFAMNHPREFRRFVDALIANGEL
ncbi:hypothetical protein [Streptomyces fagopyri]|uniref:hypothetical protein n=1 Tax=Streptomyces fagopyri TaxID=2662397 RepID=UPI0033EADDDC